MEIIAMAFLITATFGIFYTGFAYVAEEENEQENKYEEEKRENILHWKNL